MQVALALTAAEVWLPLPDWEGFYEVTRHGRYRSVDRVLSDGRFCAGRELKQTLNSKGYPVVHLRDGKRSVIYPVHKGVMKAHAGAAPAGKPQVRHLDGDKQHNCWPDNLCYGDQEDQERDKRQNGTYWNRGNKEYWNKNERLQGHNRMGHLVRPSGSHLNQVA